MVETALMVLRHPMRHAEGKSAPTVHRDKRFALTLVAARRLRNLNCEVHLCSVLLVSYDKIKFVLQSKDAGQSRVPGI